MTSQQRADEWLATWQWLRALGYTPVERDRLIDRALVEVYAGRVDSVATHLRAEATLDRHLLNLRSAHGNHDLTA